ncbi:hypothetical protein ACJRO7_005032 [Eucalyptus globulus]|uniref:Uncharacterized protein n=1 Tax=Eucalyptus globulus TaxID=34317 RepID=A0ABD3IYB7_EUCGL
MRRNLKSSKTSPHRKATTTPRNQKFGKGASFTSFRFPSEPAPPFRRSIQQRRKRTNVSAVDEEKRRTEGDPQSRSSEHEVRAEASCETARSEGVPPLEEALPAGGSELDRWRLRWRLLLLVPDREEARG